MNLTGDILFISILSFVLGIGLTKLLIKKAFQAGYVVKDMYKPNRPEIPTMGGLAIMAATLIALTIAQFSAPDVGKLLQYYFVAFVFGLYGLADDLMGFKMRYDKVFILFVLALPASSLAEGTSLGLIFTDLELGTFYRWLFVPFYIMVVANLINVHAGYNGLSGGLSTLLFIFVGVHSYIAGGLGNLVILAPMVPALIAFMWFNKFPARILLGNIGTYFLGGALGTYLVMNRMELFGFIIVLPHTINYILDFWTLKLRRVPLVKFGKVRNDGTIESPPTMKYVSLKFYVASVIRVTEPQAVMLLYSVTVAFGLLGIALFI
ncbi:MAG: hypothetical protein DWQ05_13110 [Calditrichaeota bacterium]|nr:MAG: hypothetical protein DWQ05_13110 [Calditrichota bacterium]